MRFGSIQALGEIDAATAATAGVTATAATASCHCCQTPTHLHTSRLPGIQQHHHTVAVVQNTPRERCRTALWEAVTQSANPGQQHEIELAHHIIAAASISRLLTMPCTAADPPSVSSVHSP